MCQDWKHWAGMLVHPGEALKGSLEEVTKVQQAWETCTPNLTGGMQFGTKIPPCHEMLVESLSFSEWPVPTWDVVSRQGPGRRELPRIQLWITGVHRAAGSPKKRPLNDNKVKVTLGPRANMDTG